jgi:hypothetical protein
MGNELEHDVVDTVLEKGPRRLEIGVLPGKERPQGEVGTSAHLALRAALVRRAKRTRPRPRDGHGSGRWDESIPWCYWIGSHG